MVQSYIPVLKAKQNEFLALENLPQTKLDKLTPLFEVTDPNTKSQRYITSSTPKLDYIKEVVANISKYYSDKTVFVDGYAWFDKTYDENGKHVLVTTIEHLRESNVLVIPVVGYDRWDLVDYKQAVCGLECSSCVIRLDKDAIEDSYDTEFFTDRLEGILNDLNLSASDCTVMVDFADVSKIPLSDILNNAENILTLLKSFGFESYLLAGCSIPAFITEVVKTKDSTKTILRKEVVVWKTLRKSLKMMNLHFSDYGIRGPNSAIGIMSPDTNGKIRYAVPNECLISLGHSQQAPDKWGQMKAVSKRIVDSGHFMTGSLSWGDEYILKCSQGLVPTKGVNHWIAVDTNHHLAYILQELEEYFIIEKSVPVIAT